MNAIVPQGHSPLGASATHRFMECPGSVGLAYGISDDEEDDTFSAPGQAAHKLAEVCLKSGKEAWQFLGAKAGDGGLFMPNAKGFSKLDLPVVDKEMADAVQEYLTRINEEHPDRNQANSGIEHRFHCPSIHDLFYGTSDFWYRAGRVLHVRDFKYGAGIVVEAKNNPQGMYYAAGVLESKGWWDEIDEIVIHIDQPRAYHWLSPFRDWTISTPNLIAWLEDTLVPAMDRTLVSRDTKTGEHCRFCPARYRKCPALMADMKELERMLKQLEGKTADELTNEEVSRLLHLLKVGKIVGKAAEQTAFKRLSHGKTIDGCKLVAAKANREWKEEAGPEAEAEFGDKAYADRKLRSPAQMEALPGGKDFAARYAFKPDKGLTLVFGEDTRPAVNKETKSLFKPLQRKKTAG